MAKLKELKKAKKKAKSEAKEYAKTKAKSIRVQAKYNNTAGKITAKEKALSEATTALQEAKRVLEKSQTAAESATKTKAEFKGTELKQDAPLTKIQQAISTLKKNKTAKKDAQKELKTAEANVAELKKKVAKKKKQLRIYDSMKRSKQESREQKIATLGTKLGRNKQQEAGEIAFEKSKSLVSIQQERAAENERLEVQRRQAILDKQLGIANNPPSTNIDHTGNVVAAQDPTKSFKSIPDIMTHSLKYMQSDSHRNNISTTQLEGEATELKARFQNAPTTPEEQKALNVDYGAWCASAWVNEAEYHKAVEKQFDKMLAKAQDADKEFLTQQKLEASNKAREALKHAEINAGIATDTLGQGTSKKLEAALHAVSTMNESIRTEDRTQNLAGLDTSSSTDDHTPTAAQGAGVGSSAAPVAIAEQAKAEVGASAPNAEVIVPDPARAAATPSTNAGQGVGAAAAAALQRSLTNNGPPVQRLDTSKPGPANTAAPTTPTPGNGQGTGTGSHSIVQ